MKNKTNLKLKNYIKKIIVLIIFIIWISFININSLVSAKIIAEIPVTTEVTSISVIANKSCDNLPNNSKAKEKCLSEINAIDNVTWISVRIFQVIKTLILWLAIIYMVYIWIMMIVAMWNDEDLKTQKRQLWYTMLAFLFINIPWTLVSIFSDKKFKEDITLTVNPNNFVANETNVNWNIFFNSGKFLNKITWDTFSIVAFIEVIIFLSAIISILQAWYYLLLSNWSSDNLIKARKRGVYTVLALISVMVMEAWTILAFNWKITTEWQEIFSRLANLALYFAWPVAIIFLIVAWFYFVTAAWNEDNIKKAKSIVINTFIAVVILLASYAFLLDLADLSF